MTEHIIWRKVEEPWVGKEDLWQNAANPDQYSTDEGKTYYDIAAALDSEGNPVIHETGGPRA